MLKKVVLPAPLGRSVDIRRAAAVRANAAGLFAPCTGNMLQSGSCRKPELRGIRIVRHCRCCATVLVSYKYS
jgi:hypothetical protein